MAKNGEEAQRNTEKLISGGLGALLKKLKPQINIYIDYVQLNMEATSVHTTIQEDNTITIHISIKVGYYIQ